MISFFFFFFFQAEDGIRDIGVTGVQTCALPISSGRGGAGSPLWGVVSPGRRRVGPPRPGSRENGDTGLGPRGAGGRTAGALRGGWKGRARRVSPRALGIDAMVVPQRLGARRTAPRLPRRLAGLRYDASLAGTVRTRRGRHLALGMDGRRGSRAGAPRRPLDGRLRLPAPRGGQARGRAPPRPRRPRRGANRTVHGRAPRSAARGGPLGDARLPARARQGRPEGGTRHPLAGGEGPARGGREGGPAAHRGSRAARVGREG